MSSITPVSGNPRASVVLATLLALAAPFALTACQSAAPATTTAAAAVAPVATERPATADEIRTVAVGRTMSGGMTYNADGTYLFQGANPGRYEISDGRICVKFTNGASRCDRIVVDGSSYTMINAGGRRFPFG
ncbi:MAG: hypothetical protein IBJ07_09975 [Rhizobiaceae bacterium]|nr:hypothetical protein [Rhizobiaceae bacterium]